mmetsp:Transcript_13660/g.34313  ORF Transcript_13660/g.34313 Transcript_13660/m.34313 type:complete len:139 (+) Transcript_13660:110-526(+)
MAYRASTILAMATATFVTIFISTEAAHMELRGAMMRSNATFTINDQVFVNGAMYAESAALNDHLGCNEYPAGTSSFKVCGCGVKVHAFMMTECQQYEHYDTQIGQCDCSTKACDEKTLSSGYTDKFEWKAVAFKISAC